MISQWIGAMIFALILLSLVFVWIRWRYFRLDYAKRALERQVADLSRQLEYSNGLKQKITMMIAHDLQSPLHFLNLLSDHVARFAANNQLPEVKAGTEEIRKATGNIHAFVKEVNLWARSQHENFQVAKYAFEFDELFAELEQFFAEMLLINGNRLTGQYPRDIFIHTNRDILKAILRNLIDNANKHTNQGKITVAIEHDRKGDPILVVSDTGSGMLPADLLRITRRINNPAADIPVESNSRLGYQIIIDFAYALDYTLSVSSTRGKGTSVVISGLICKGPIQSRLHSSNIVGICQPD